MLQKLLELGNKVNALEGQLEEAKSELNDYYSELIDAEAEKKSENYKDMLVHHALTHEQEYIIRTIVHHKSLDLNTLKLLTTEIDSTHRQRALCSLIKSKLIEVEITLNGSLYKPSKKAISLSKTGI